MKFHEIITILQATLGDNIISQLDDKALQPSITIDKNNLLEVCNILYTNPKLYFDFLACITAIDNGLEKNTLEIIYNLTSIPYEHNLMLKVLVTRNTTEEKLPQIASVSSIWKTADWHEREAYDLMGIEFVGHSDLRRILLPTDWVGHPLRKDYVEQEKYHGIKVKAE